METKKTKGMKSAILAMERLVIDVKSFREIYDALSEEESRLVGGVIVGIFSPIGDISHGAGAGQSVVLEGILVRLGKIISE